MAFDAHIGSGAERGNESHQFNDNLQVFRDGGRDGGAQLTSAVYTSTADAHLPLMQIADNQEQPFNPMHAAGTYNPAAIVEANKHFNPAEVRALESSGPNNFNQMMDQVKNAPPQVSEMIVKALKANADAQLRAPHNGITN